MQQDDTPMLKRGQKSNQPRSLVPIEADGPLWSPKLVLTSRNKTAWCNELEQDPAVLRYVVSLWVRAFDLHFGWRSPENGEVQYLYLLFEHAKAAETIAAVIEVMDPDAAKALHPDIGLRPLGSTCCNLYRCHDYMSCGHWDRDGVKPLKQEPAARKVKTGDPPSERLSDCVRGCAQYHNNCLPDEFNFVYTEWGVLVKTVPGCVWVFNSDNMHQVTLPCHSSVNKAGGEPMCSGDNPTVTSANAAKAQAFERAPSSCSDSRLSETPRE
ncbi:hypothetical protein K438DRAFT_378312 [Mycena galopus ATCC 62051]|nr:hypothetical protein K438DRAFT_378312 [Mycena galopus ATCC 62051]